MKRIVLTVSMLLATILLLSSCTLLSSADFRRMERDLEIKVPDYTAKYVYDFHPYVNGDGTSVIAYELRDDKVLNQIKENPKWKAFPLDETMTIILYGITYETPDGKYTHGPYICHHEHFNDHIPILPKIQNGYYILVDRQKYEKENIFERASYNFTVGVYDTDTDILYYCTFDT